jgi:hypothetical protein
MQKSSEFNWRSLFVFILSGIGLLSFLPLSALLIVSGVLGLMQKRLPSAEIQPIFSLTWACLATCLLLLPSLVITFLDMIGKPLPRWRLPDGLRLSSIFLVVWALVFTAGALLSERGSSLNWLLMPPIQVLVLGLPFWWLAELAMHRLPSGSAGRKWSLLSVGILVTPLLVFILEAFIIGALFIALVVWFTSRPDMAAEISRLAQRIANANMNPEVISRIMLPLVQKPAFLFGAVFVVAGAVPLVEEMFKSLPVWGLARRGFTPAEGFGAGAVCGATFAFAESLGFLASSTGTGWYTLVLGRLGTGVLHMVTTALMGWALASAWQNRRYLQLGLCYLLAVSFHGIWNTLGLLMGMTAFLNKGQLSGVAAVALRLGEIAPAGLAALSFLLLGLVLLGKRSMLRSISDSQSQSAKVVS